MGRKSIKEKKTFYQLVRERLDYSREEAAGISEIESYTIERIENEKSTPKAYDVLQLADGYKEPFICNYYCTNECPIGMRYVPKIEEKELAQLVIGLLSSLNLLQAKEEKLISIIASGAIEKEEIKEFILIKKELEKLASEVLTLKLWTDKMIAIGKIDEKTYKETLKTMKKEEKK